MKPRVRDRRVERDRVDESRQGGEEVDAVRGRQRRREHRVVKAREAVVRDAGNRVTGNGVTAERNRDGADRPGGGFARGVDGGPLRKQECARACAAGKTTQARPPSTQGWRAAAANFGNFPEMGRV